jgi:hypothetical protein
MNIAVLACGPSLKQHYHASMAFDLVVAVNTAGWLFPCDWLAFSDRHIIEPVTSGTYALPRRGLLSNKGWRTTAQAHGLEWEPLPIYDYRLKNLTPEMCGLAIQQGMTECGFTFPNALFFASRLADQAGDRVHVFGFDCAMQEGDVAGVKGYHTRKRWLTELPWIKACWLDNFIPHCAAHPTILRWLDGRESDEAMHALFPKEEVPC